jgi:endonuclease/exonuclease/phosphatase family metal-dependent hydrolase
MIYRNVLKASIEVPGSGEVEFHCTHLDHLDEKWRMKQVDAIIQSTNVPHILAGALNSLDESDYSPERWTDIVKVHYPNKLMHIYIYIYTSYQSI